MRTVFDTNVYISAFIVPGSKGAAAFDLARRRRCELYTSVPILTETANKLRQKFGRREDDVKAAIKLISRVAQIVRPKERLDVVEDEPDNRILECAASSAADVIVSGDRHLLALRAFQGAAIVRVAEFLRLFPATG